MVKFAFFFFIALCITNALFAQKTFELTIKLDSSINPKKMHYQYENGKGTIFLPDTFGDSRNVIIKGIYYSQLLSFAAGYVDTGKKYYYNDFFLTDKPAALTFYNKPNNYMELKYSSSQNVKRVYDTVENKIQRELEAYKRREDTLFIAFMMENQDRFGKSDSLRRIFKKLYKKSVLNAMAFLKRYPDDYYSFWYFRNQLVQLPNGFLNTDTTLIEKQYAYLKAVYPPKFTQSEEGKNLLQLFETWLNPLKKGEPAPLFSFSTLEGKKLKLADLKGKYVLLDFWATWCGPCMAEIPFIKQLRKKYPADKLVIVGISQDRDKRKWQETIKTEDMNWLHHLDTNADIAHLYGVNLFPTLVLIDKKGKTIYVSDGKTNDKDILPDVLSLTGTGTN